MNLPQFIGHHQVLKVFYFPFMGSIPYRNNELAVEEYHHVFVDHVFLLLCLQQFAILLG